MKCDEIRLRREGKEGWTCKARPHTAVGSRCDTTLYDKSEKTAGNKRRLTSTMTCRAGFCVGGAADATAAEVDDSSPATAFHFPSPAITRNRLVGFAQGCNSRS